MPFEDPVEPLSDIFEHIGHIEKFLKGMGPVDLAKDQRTLFACQYALLALIWKVYQDDLPPLKVGVQAALERFRNRLQEPPTAH